MMNSLATIEEIVDILQHPDPEVKRLEIVKVLNFNCIVGKGIYKVGEKVILIRPDTVLPDEPWTGIYKKFNPSRVKAQKLRGYWSFGIVEKVGLLPGERSYEVGEEVSQMLGITKYVTPVPEEPGAIAGLPHNLIPSNETLYQSLPLDKYLGQLVDVTLKVDGSSVSYYYANGNFKVCGRNLEIDLNKINKYTHHVTQLNIDEKLAYYCKTHKVNLALRGEIYGQGIQSSKNNPHSKLPLNVVFYNVWLIDEMRYAFKEHKYYFSKVCKELELPYVDILEENVVLTYDLLKKYDEDLEKVDGQPFEGVVIKGKDFSFKVINKHYDSKK
ncbi:hypothetical protein H6G76_16160 [Nostoc sp. FACHB-152]|uniref:RNA ligase family protein n=1 Tax=unclassified Nostoc TaxID=2593658 RepID=UPI001685F465|nr:MULTISPECIES: RNA ligase family protein [unclassified Nostoc]MBD2448657.1 hypothetical protein [Nostoc sp. FACHB-152]MBD2468358.1 hypothetical protein [Nostoc sp. FACHB-145]